MEKELSFYLYQSLEKVISPTSGNNFYQIVNWLAPKYDFELI